MPELIYLGTGTNLGDRAANLAAVRAALPPKVRVLRASHIYETEPWGYTDQPTFLNQALEVETELSPTELLAYLKNLEAQIGRTPSFRYGPRLIDIDILFFGERIVQEENLAIPHPMIPERAFVLVPLAELIPSFRHPILGQTVLELRLCVDADSVHRFQ